MDPASQNETSLESRTVTVVEELESPEKTPFCCEHCSEAFTEEEGLKRHLSLTHSEQISVASGDLKHAILPFVNLELNDITSCLPASQDAPAPPSVSGVVKDATDQGSEFVLHCNCDKCGKSLMAGKDLESHICMDDNFVPSIRSDGDILKATCKRKCQQNQDFPEASKVPKVEIEDANEGEPKIYTCQECFEEFSSKSNLQEHISSHEAEPQLDASPEQEDKKVTSEVEGVVTQEKSEANVEDVLKLFVCELCGHSFIQKMMLEAHKDASHLGMKYRCNTCGIDFKRKSNFIRHNTNLHSDLTYKCKKCPKAFARKIDLERHMKAHLAKENQSKDVIRCADCDMVFVYKKDLKIHRRESHKVAPLVTDIQPIVIPDFVIKEHGAVSVFRCSLCPRAFSLKTDLHRHFLVHSGEKPFACDMCDSKFNRKSNLVRHKKLMHHITENRQLLVKTELGGRRKKQEYVQPWEREIKRQEEEIRKWNNEQRQMGEVDDNEERHIYWGNEVESDQEDDSMQVAYFKPDDKITVRILTFE